KALLAQQALTQDQKAQIQTALAENEKNINNIKAQLKETTTNITLLKGKVIQLEKEKAVKEQAIKQKQEAEKLASPDDKIRLRAEIDQLQDEVSEIIGKISDIKSQIGILEATREKYQGMLADAKHYQQRLKDKFTSLNEQEKKLYEEIKSVEQRRMEIQQNIEEIDKKLGQIEIERDLYQALKVKYREMYTRMLTYEKEHEASAGNIVKWSFKAFDKVTDLIPAKYGLKIIGKTVSFTRKFSQGMAKTTLILHEGHRLWHMYNEVSRENKEHPPMINKDALEMYTKDIDRDLAKLDADYKDYEHKKEGYKQRQEQENLKREFHDAQEAEKTREFEVGRHERSFLNEYRNIIEELTIKEKEIKGIDKLENDQYKLEEDLENKKDEINEKKEELKQKNPSYARAQERLKAKRIGKLPEMVVINN
ncbi:MAG: DNA double-strand break repair protein Rad50, partial [Vigna little leaf phytoplasma]|nr:DNA double-strand break repair protein Rad50 [Vigna little leaf phytoplasma]